jgi:putative transcriptional regulator
LKAKTTTITIRPVESFRSEEIRAIRKNTGMTQVLFAKYMGVSVKTVEAWEAGRNHPEGTACRLLSMTQKDPLFPQKSGIVSMPEA